MFYILELMPGVSLGTFELAIMLSIGALDHAYSASIRREVSRRLERQASVGAVHTTLQRLEAKRLVTSWDAPPLPRRGGRARRVYRLTALGGRLLRASRDLHLRLWDGWGDSANGA
ncbi:MAG: helix-turn-helix transcriptional regulator [Gemmatimonadaceae bacterium]